MSMLMTMNNDHVIVPDIVKQEADDVVAAPEEQAKASNSDLEKELVSHNLFFT